MDFLISILNFFLNFIGFAFKFERLMNCDLISILVNFVRFGNLKLLVKFVFLLENM